MVILNSICFIYLMQSFLLIQCNSPLCGGVGEISRREGGISTSNFDLSSEWFKTFFFCFAWDLRIVYVATFQIKKRISYLPNLITNGFTRDNVLKQKQNNICIGLKNYHVLMVLRQNSRFSTHMSTFGPHWEHILHKSFISGGRFKSTRKSKGLKVCLATA